MGGISDISPVLFLLCTKGFPKIMGEMTHFKEYWADGEEHFEEVSLSCQKLENDPVGYENQISDSAQKHLWYDTIGAFMSTGTKQ